ncbi:hypothetical protein AB0C07_07945 [Actinoplanes missouriensis]|uniref:hypothetical protein n=1 Tax=Actinoplanes missouriensis TaxID=1866 RepID=UPI0033C6A775
MVIDLDQPPQHESRRRRLTGTRAVALVVLGSFLAGVLVGGVTAYLRWYRPVVSSAEEADRAASATVSVLLFAEPGMVTADGGRRQVRIEAQVTVVNAGPAPVNVMAVRVGQPGVTVRSAERERQIAPGAETPVDVTVEFDCTADEPLNLAASITAETEDEQLRTVAPVALHGTPWIQSRQDGCARVG